MMKPDRKAPPHPGVFVRDLLTAHKLNVTKGAAALGVSRVTLSRFLNGDADLSGDMAVRVGKAFGVGFEKLLQMQFAHDLAATRARAKRIDVPRYRRVA